MKPKERKKEDKEKAGKGGRGMANPKTEKEGIPRGVFVSFLSSSSFFLSVLIASIQPRTTFTCSKLVTATSLRRRVS